MSIDIPTAHKTELKFPFGELDSMIEWCEKNCHSEWKFSDSDNGYTFYFDSEKDYFAFMIWKA
jgi:hypothetical protein